MMRTLLVALFTCVAATSYAQTTMPVPPKAISQLENLKELTKAEAVAGKTKKAHAEVRPELNRYFVISADDFLRVAANGATKEGYLKCMDTGLARMAPLVSTPQDRQQVAEYFQELMEIVGLESSDGRLAAFVGTPKEQQ
jgi:hypothetical protein